MGLGVEIGRGVRSVVYAYGDGQAAKLTNAGVPTGWLVEEARLAAAAERAGARAPRGTRLVEIDGATALVADRVVGPSMWERLASDPACAAELAVDMARIQAELAMLPASFELPAQRDRIRSKVYAAARRHGAVLERVLDLLPPDSGPLVLCHGDLHPRNLLIAAEGPVLVDWFDAARGSLVGDIARTVIILEESHDLEPGLDPAFRATIAEFSDVYTVAACQRARITGDDLEPWLVVQSVARLAEGFGLHRLDEMRRRLT